jgi:multiple sugar transport system substrate-binding protein
MKKAITLLCITLLVASFGAFTGCSAKKGDTVKNKPVTITFWNGYTGPDGEILTEYVDKFNKTNPYGITVEMDINAQFLTKIAAAFAGGKAPDMVLGPSSFKDQYPDYLVDMNEVFKSTSLKKDDWVGGYMDVCSGGDKLYAVPLQITGRFMYWNKDLFKAAGLDPEKGPSSYEEWAKWASLITDKSKNIYGSGVPFNSIFNTVHLLQRMGGLFIDYDANGKLVPRFKDNKGYAQFLNWYGGMIKSGDNPLEVDMDSMMKAGQLGIMLSGAFLTSGLEAAGINYGVSQLPYGDAGPQNPCSVGGLSVTTSASEEAKVAAFRFIEWWFSGDANTDVSGILNWSLVNGYPSCYMPAIKDARYQSSKKLAAMTNVDPKAVTTYLAPKEFNKTFQLANEVIESTIESVVSNGKDAYKALDDAQAKANELLK